MADGCTCGRENELPDVRHGQLGNVAAQRRELPDQLRNSESGLSQSGPFDAGCFGELDQYNTAHSSCELHRRLYHTADVQCGPESAEGAPIEFQLPDQPGTPPD